MTNELAPVTSLEEKDILKDILCVSLFNGTTGKLQGASVEEVLAIVEKSIVTWVNVTVTNVTKDTEKIASKFGFDPSIIPSLLSGYMASYEDFNTIVGLKVPAVLVDKFEVEINPLIILMKKNLILTIHEERIKRLVKFSRYAEIFLKKIPSNISWNDRLSIILLRILDENNEKNFEGLRSIESQGDEIGKFLADAQAPREKLGMEIYNMKHSLITYLNILWATLDVLNSLRYGDAELITDDEKLLARFTLLAGDVTRHIALSEHMSEVLASGLEVLQSIYNNQLQILNNRMSMVTAWLTVLGTAVLVPNTIATVMSNDAFALKPKDAGWYSLLLIVSTILSTLIAYLWIKKKAKFPQKID